MKVSELKYSVSNNYLIQGDRGLLLFDTGWAGTLPGFFQAIGTYGISVRDINYILISHFHPDHCGIAQEIADLGPQIAVMDVQRNFIHASDRVFEKEPKLHFKAIEEEKARMIPLSESRSFLQELGIQGEILHTPGHSDDSISLFLDSGELFVGDLNPLYEMALHQGTEIGKSWEKLLLLRPRTIYYGHAKTAVLDQEKDTHEETPSGPGPEAPPCGHDARKRSSDRYLLVSKIMKYSDRHMDARKIQKKTGADPQFIEDVLRMYLTHRDVGVQGILDRIEIKNR